MNQVYHPSLAESDEKRLTIYRTAIKKRVFTCNECEFSTKSIIGMRQHVEDHLTRNSEIKYRKCLFCNFETHDQVAMIQHTCPSVEATMITCQYCEIQLPPQEIQLHLTEMHARLIELTFNNVADDLFSCYYCGYTTSDKESLRSHVAVHIGEKRMTGVVYIEGRKYFKCQFCDYKTWRLGCFRRHMDETRKHGGQKNYRCKKCGRTFLRKQHLNSHNREVHMAKAPDERSPCDKCGKIFPSKFKLDHHMRSHKEKLFACDMCKFKGPSASALRRHKMMVHLNFRPFPCPECDHRAKTKNGLEIHLLTHSTEKRFNCPHCEYRSNRKFVLHSHIKHVHCSEKPFACPECEFKTKSKGGLVAHFKRHVNVKPFGCPAEGCDHRTFTATAMKAHSAKHTGARPFGCPFCEYRASRSFLIKSHVQNRHKSLESEYLGPMKGL
ncbi:unnamed protein product [Nesidiocoris tenuis]|uniref:C2H2-type domain-containing protein n=1 Tax=Nesidiocoris tenuis TaxID=355587 RepID=A0A6H5HQI6_9HEMI|nr:unnamed protein product [Nesidiocoris tenuis]